MNRTAHARRIRLALLLLALQLPAVAAVAQYSNDAHTPRPGMWRIGISAGAVGMGCDVTTVESHYRYNPFGEISAAAVMHRSLHLGVAVGFGRMSAESEYTLVENDFASVSLLGEYRVPIARGMLVPFAYGRIGGIVVSPSFTVNGRSTQGERRIALTFGIGGGFEFVYRRLIGLRLLGGGYLTTTDDLDGLIQGTNNDGAAYFAVGASWYFSSR